MLNIGFLRNNREEVVKRLSIRIDNAQKKIEDILNLDSQRREEQSKLDSIASELNNISKEIGLLFKTENNKKASALKNKASQLKIRKDEISKQLSHVADQLHQSLCEIPNIPDSAVAKGYSSDDNEEIYRFGEIPKLYHGALSHWELAKKFDIIDFDMGSKITGSGFPVYKGKGARLQRALINYFIDKNVAAGYKEVQVPYLVNEASAFGTGQLPDKEGQMYHIVNDNLFLIPTGEVPATNIFRDVIFELNELPKKLTTYTPCFRREAGSYGAHVRGLNRLHQFDKVEILQVENPKESHKALEEMISHVKGIVEELNLPYRILKLCSGDLGFTSSLTYDFEIFSAAQKQWLEISSVSNFGSFQANRLKLRYRSADGKIELPHTLNGSSLALPRVMAGILENYQKEEIIKIPEILIPYAGFEYID